MKDGNSRHHGTFPVPVYQPRSLMIRHPAGMELIETTQFTDSIIPGIQGNNLIFFLAGRKFSDRLHRPATLTNMHL